MKKLWIVFFSLLLTIVGARADQVKTLVLTLIDGTKVEFALPETPTISYPENMIHVESASLTAEYPLYRVADIHFEESTTSGVKEVEEQVKTLRIEYTVPGEVVLRGHLDGRTVSLYTVGGALLKTMPTKQDSEELNISTAGLQAGTYIVNINGLSSFKINVK